MSWQDVQFHNTVVITLKALSDTDDMLYLYWGIGYNEPDNELYTDIQNIRLLSGKFITYEFSVKTRWLKIVSPNTVIESICYKSAPTSNKSFCKALRSLRKQVKSSVVIAVASVARLSPITQLSSSTEPMASMRGQYLDTRFPFPSDVFPVSPPRVAMHVSCTIV